MQIVDPKSVLLTNEIPRVTIVTMTDSVKSRDSVEFRIFVQSLWKEIAANILDFESSANHWSTEDHY